MMMKKYASLLFALVLALSLSVSAAADSSGVYVYDDAALLTQEEYDTLTASAMAVADQYGCGVYVVTVDDMADYIDPDAVTETGETGMAAFTEYAWDALGLAASYDSNGIMLALSMAERDFQMLAHGDTANAAFTDYGKYIMQDEFLDNFREDDWYGGFEDYVKECGVYLEKASAGKPVRASLFYPLLIVIGLSLLAAAAVVAVIWRKMDTVSKKATANDYVSAGLRLTEQTDHFTHKTTSRRKIERSSSSGGSSQSESGGGGSGRSGKF